MPIFDFFPFLFQISESKRNREANEVNTYIDIYIQLLLEKIDRQSEGTSMKNEALHLFKLE